MVRLCLDIDNPEIRKAGGKGSSRRANVEGTRKHSPVVWSYWLKIACVEAGLAG